MANLVLCVFFPLFGLKNTFSFIYMQILSAASMKQLTSWYSPPMLMNALKILLALSLCMIIAFSTDQLFFQWFYCRSLQQLQWSSWRAAPAPFIKECTKHVNTLHMCPFCLKKQTNLNVLTTDTFSSFIEAVDELFQHTLSYECMEHHVHTIAMI